nr:beta-carotene hydroxylase [Ipomoea trifida]
MTSSTKSDGQSPSSQMHSVLSSGRKPSLTVCFVLEDEKLESRVEIRAEEIEKVIEKQISASRLTKKLARKRSERFTYLVAAVMSSFCSIDYTASTPSTIEKQISASTPSTIQL